MWDFDRFGHNTAVITENNASVSYKELKNAAALLTRKISKRCLVFILCNNHFGAFLGYTAFLNSNIVPVMLDMNLDRSLLDALVTSYKPDYLWIPEQMVQSFCNVTEIYSAYGFVLTKTPYDHFFPLSEELALLLTTSGSTGSPKFVRQSYANIQANTESIVKYLELDKTEKPITTLPMNYTYGLSIINSHLFVGATIILTDKTLMQKEFWSTLKEQGATSFGGVPYTYEILDKLRFYRMDLPSLRTMTQAGGKLSPELHQKIAEYAESTGKHFVVMYGQTEATARMAYLPYQKSLEKVGSMGIAIPGGKFSLIDVNGNKISDPNVVGELVYEGANVTLGYAERGADLINGDERGGKLITGDMAKFDADGYYYIVGRK